jgi:hypothetical protein
MTIQLDARLTHFIANGNAMGYGRAENERQALKNMREFSCGGKPTEYRIFMVGEQTTVDHMGSLTWPLDGPTPVQIKHVKNKKVLDREPKFVPDVFAKE